MRDEAVDSPTNDEAAPSYQAISPQAVGGLLLGLISVAALFHVLFWFVPLLAVAMCGWALRRIAVYWPTYTGRTAALVGLALAVFWGTAAPVSWWIQRASLVEDAEQFAEGWFDLLRHDDPLRAHQLTLAPSARRPFDAALPNVYRDDPPLRAELEEFVAQPPVRALLALGEQAQVRLYHTDQVGGDASLQIVVQTYAISHGEPGARKTFFVSTVVTRAVLTRLDTAQWRIRISSLQDRPPELAGLPGDMPSRETPLAHASR